LIRFLVELIRSIYITRFVPQTQNKKWWRQLWWSWWKNQGVAHLSNTFSSALL